MSIASATLYLRATFAFDGGNVVVTDRADVGGELRVLDWGSILVQMDQGADHVELKLSNLPIGGFRFSDRWSALQPPEGVTVTIEWSQAAIGSPPAWKAFLVGSIAEVSSVSEQEVTVQVGDVLSEYERDIGDPITTSEFPQAASGAIGAAKPVVLGEVKGWTPPVVRERKRATTKQEILATDTAPFNLPVDSTEGWPTSGTLKIDDEIFAYSILVTTPEDNLRITARAQSSTAADDHDYGSTAIERTTQTWLVADHACASVDTVYAVASDGSKVTLDAAKYVVTNPDVYGRTTIESVSEDDEEVEIPSTTPVYMRVDMDEVGTPQTNGGFGFGLSAQNPAGAAAALDSWQPTSFAVLRTQQGAFNFGNDTLALKRSESITKPKTPISKAYLCVEHYGIEEFGEISKLAYSIDASQTAIIVTTTLPFQNKNTWPNVLKQIRIGKEDLQVTAIDAANSTLTVTRGFLGSTASEHAKDDRVFVIEQIPTVSSGKVRIFPEIRTWIETSAGSTVYTNLGELYDVSDIPEEVKQEQEPVETAQSIASFHGHQVDNGVFKSGLYPTSKYNVADDKMQSIGALAVATVRTKATEEVAYSELLTPEVVRRVKLDSTNPKVRFIFAGTNQSLSTSWLQRIQALRFRVVHAATGNAGTAPTQIEARFYIGSGNNQLLAFTKTAFNSGGVGATTGPTVSTFDVPNIQTLSSAGIFAIDLFSRHTSLVISRTSADTDVYSVQVDAIFEEGQFVFQSTESINDRAVITGAFDLVWNRDGGYANGVVGVKSDTILELMAAQSHYYLLSDAAASFKVLGPGATQDGLVLAATNGTGTKETKRFDCYWTGIAAPGESRVLSIVVVMDVAYLQNTNGTGFSPVRLVNDTTGEVFDPKYEDWGAVTTTLTPIGEYTRTTFFWRWSFSANEPQSFANTEITVEKLVRDFRVRFVATGTKTANEAYINAITYRIEVESKGSQSSISTEPQKFTRVSYFDVSDTITDYDDIIDRTVQVQLGKFHSVSNEKAKPILVNRVFWLFRYFEPMNEPFDRIAVDCEGIALTSNTDAIKKVLTNGYPLLSVPTVQVSSATFALAETLGALAISGVVDKPIPARDLIQAMAEQAKCSLFWWSGSFLSPLSSVAVLAFKEDLTTLSSPSFVFSWSAGDMFPDSFILEYRTKDSVGNVVTVRADRDYARGGFKVTSEKKWDASITKYKRRPFELDAEWLTTQDDADALALQLLQYRYDREILVSWMSPPITKALNLAPGYIIQIVHPMLSTVRGRVVTVRLAPNSLASGLPPQIEISAVVLPAGIAGETVDAPTQGGDGT